MRKMKRVHTARKMKRVRMARKMKCVHKVAAVRAHSGWYLSRGGRVIEVVDIDEVNSKDWCLSAAAIGPIPYRSPKQNGMNYTGTVFGWLAVDYMLEPLTSARRKALLALTDGGGE